jgi:hypothetical protein
VIVVTSFSGFISYRAFEIDERCYFVLCMVLFPMGPMGLIVIRCYFVSGFIPYGAYGIDCYSLLLCLWFSFLWGLWN